MLGQYVINNVVTHIVKCETPNCPGASHLPVTPLDDSSLDVR